MRKSHSFYSVHIASNLRFVKHSILWTYIYFYRYIDTFSFVLRLSSAQVKKCPKNQVKKIVHPTKCPRTPRFLLTQWITFKGVHEYFAFDGPTHREGHKYIVLFGIGNPHTPVIRPILTNLILNSLYLGCQL